MSRPDYDAVVIGAGPAGSLAGRGLALAGRRVALLDKQKFPRPKVCGCCLNRYALANLDRAGLGHLAEQLGAPPLRQLDMIAGGRRATIPLPAGVSLSREAMDTALIEAACKEGVEFNAGVSAKVEPWSSPTSEIRTVRLGDGSTLSAKVIIVADGLGGTSLKNLPGFNVQTAPASRIGFGGSTNTPTTPQHRATVAQSSILMACGKHGYLGAVELEDGRLDLAAAVDAAAVKSTGGWAALAESMLAESGLSPDALPIEDVKQWRATPALTRRRAKLAGPGIFVVGDAAGYVEPFTGEGMAWAIAGGTAVAPIACQAIAGWRADQETTWQSEFTRHVRRRQAGCRLVAATLRRSWLTRGVVRALSKAPGLADPLVRHITRPGRDTNPITSGIKPWALPTGSSA